MSDHATIAPDKPPVLVFIMVRATASAFSFEAIEPTEPPLKPNQPIHSKNAPRVTSGIFEAGITLTRPFLLYFPFLAPIIRIAAIKAQPPVEWITVDPARSDIAEISSGVPAKKFAPHVILTMVG